MNEGSDSEAEAAWREAYAAGCAGACGCDRNEEAEAILREYKRRKREAEALSTPPDRADHP